MTTLPIVDGAARSPNRRLVTVLAAVLVGAVSVPAQSVPADPGATGREQPAAQGKPREQAGPGLPEGCPDPGENPFPAVDAGALRQRLAAAGHPAEALQAWDEARRARGLAAATEQILMERYPAYRDAVRAAATGSPRAALDLTKTLAASAADRVLRSHCRYHLGRVFLDGGDPERAAEILFRHLQEDPGISGLDGEVLFFHGRALAEIPAREAAVRALAGFLKWFPGAPGQLREAATAALREQLARAGAPLHEIADAMQQVERALAEGDSGEAVQQRQRQITAQLTQLLQKAQEQEQQQGSGSQADSQPGNPSEESKLPPGGSRFGNLQPTPSVAERWGDLQDAERAAIRGQLAEDLPPHYRRMLEAYYLRLARGER